MRKNVSVHIESLITNIDKLLTIDKENNNYEILQCLDNIRDSLNREYNNIQCMAVLISYQPKYKYEIFGARTYPTHNELTHISKALTDLNSNNFKLREYIIELDYGVLYNNKINITTEELVAILLHEVGHIIHFDYYLNKTKQQLAISYATTTGVGVGTVAMISGILPIPVYAASIIALYLFNDTTSKKGYYNNEVLADSFSIEQGFGNELKTVLNKIYKYKDGPLMSNNKFYQLIIQKTRQNRLHDIDRMLEIEKQQTDSPTLKEHISFIQKISKKGDNATDKNLLQHSKAAYQESMTAFFDIMAKGYSNLEIEELYVELQRMTTYEDKACLVHRIGKDKLKASKALQYAKDELTIKKIKEYQNELNKLSEKLRETNPEREYGVLVKMPIGYEG